jgi:hypothetical protein
MTSRDSRGSGFAPYLKQIKYRPMQDKEIFNMSDADDLNPNPLKIEKEEFNNIIGIEGLAKK